MDLCVAKVRDADPEAFGGGFVGLIGPLQWYIKGPRSYPSKGFRDFKGFSVIRVPFTNSALKCLRVVGVCVWTSVFDGPGLLYAGLNMVSASPKVVLGGLEFRVFWGV